MEVLPWLIRCYIKTFVIDFQSRDERAINGQKGSNTRSRSFDLLNLFLYANVCMLMFVFTKKKKKSVRHKEKKLTPRHQEEIDWHFELYKRKIQELLRYYRRIGSQVNTGKRKHKESCSI